MINKIIQHALTLHSKYEFLHGGCYALAKALTDVCGGEILVNRKKEHCVAHIHGAYYDITGSVKNINDYHPFRPKEEKCIKREYFLISPNYTESLIERLKTI